MESGFAKIARTHEIQMIINILEEKGMKGKSLLEIGAGGGWQARKLADAGFKVTAIDVASSRYRIDRDYDVMEFNGEDIPFPDNSFDVIFSSNVLEHVQNPVKLSKEIRRVLKPDGLQLHLLPSGSWRILTTLNHFPFILKFIFLKLFKKKGEANQGIAVVSSGRKWWQKVLPMRHGETGNVLTESWWFSRWGWDHQFKKWNLNLTRTGSNGILYSGYGLFGNFFSFSFRHLMARLFGATCHVYQGKK